MMMDEVGLKLVSINIEGRKHLDRVDNFLRGEQPDVVCLQEICEQDIGMLADCIGGQYHFVPMHYDNKSGDTSGIAVVSRLSFETTVFRFAGSSEKLPVFDKTNFESKYNSQRFELLIIVLNYAGKIFTIATTHLPVTGNGLSTSFQFKAMRELLNFLNTIPSFVLTGDLNTPRGGEVFDQIARRYTDNIPRNYSTSIDQKLHRAAPLELMVDGLFSTNDYLVTNVRLQCGVSDHCAVCSEVFIKN